MALDPKWTSAEMVAALEELEETTRPLLHLDGSRCVTAGCTLPHVREGDCKHERQIPHVAGDGSGRYRWTCSDCYLALPVRPPAGRLDTGTSGGISDWLDAHGVPEDARD